MLMRQMGSQKTERIWLGVGTRLRAARSAFFFFSSFFTSGQKRAGVAQHPSGAAFGMSVSAGVDGAIRADSSYHGLRPSSLEVSRSHRWRIPGVDLGLHMRAHVRTPIHCQHKTKHIQKHMPHTHEQTNKQAKLACRAGDRDRTFRDPLLSGVGLSSSRIHRAASNVFLPKSQRGPKKAFGL